MLTKIRRWSWVEVSVRCTSSFFVKLWWNFRIQNTLWTNFIWIKYIKRHRPQVVEWRGDSQTWKYMLLARDYFDQGIWWEPKCGYEIIWLDNWTKKELYITICP